MTTTVENSPAGTRLLNKLNTYPLVHDTYDQAFSYYNWVKSSTPLVSGPLNLAESGVRKVAYTTQPILTRLDKPLSKFEDAAVYSLHQIETRYPVVLKPSQEIIQDTREYVEPFVKPIANTYHNVGQRLSDAQVAIFTNVIVNQVKTYGLDSLSQFGNSDIGKTSLKTLEQLLDQADYYADKYLPEESEKKEKNEKIDGQEDQVEETKDTEKENGSQILRKSMRLTSKMQRRMQTRAMKALTEVKLRSEESLKQLHFTVDLMEYARTGVDGLKGAWAQVKDEVVDTMEELDDKKETEKSGSQVVDVARQYANTARLTALASSKVVYKHLSKEHQEQLDKAVAYSEELYTTLLKTESINNLSRNFFIHSREALKFIQQSFDAAYIYLSNNKLTTKKESDESTTTEN